MKNLIIIYSNKKQLRQFLRAAFGKTQHSNTEIFSYRNITVILTPTSTAINSPNSIVVFLDINNIAIKITNATACIVSSDNTSALKQLAGKEIPCLTCGNSISDSICLSSITEEKIIICQQRNIKTINGEVLEPREFPVLRKNNCPIEILLLASATRAVIGV